MNTDIRLSTEFWDHPKTVKLERRLGLQGPKSLQVLWLWSAKNHPDGRLEGEDVEGIEIAAKWPGEEGKFVETLLALRWLDKDGDAFCLHDWREHNEWASEVETRGDAARLSRLARVNKEAAAGLKADGRTGITKDEYRMYAEGTAYERRTTVPTTPAPAPTLRVEDLKNKSAREGFDGEGQKAATLVPSPEDDPDVQPNADISDLNECLIEFQELADVYQRAGGLVDTVTAYKAYLPMRFRFPRDRIVADLAVRSQADAWKRQDIPTKLSTYLGRKMWLEPIPAARASPRDRQAGRGGGDDWMAKYGGSCIPGGAKT